jgi:DNA-binding NtrC family response regulator
MRRKRPTPRNKPLAIIDVVLQQTNGIDLAILLTAQCPACRVLLFSGHAVTDDLLAEAAKKGYKFEILAKPTHPTVMLETALNLLAANQSNKTQEATASEELRLAEAEQPSMVYLSELSVWRSVSELIGVMPGLQELSGESKEGRGFRQVNDLQLVSNEVVKRRGTSVVG